MDTAPRVFVSYSHDTDPHRERVLALSERLRSDGIPTDLDQYVNGAPPEGWPRWMLNRLDESDRVLLICTPTYYRRFRSHEEPGKGKGVDWEGAIVTQEIYDARSRTTRFIPILFDPDDAGSVPEPVRGHTHYCLTSEAAYLDLYDALLDQAGVEPGKLGALKRRGRRRGQPLRLPDPAQPNGGATADPIADPVAPVGWADEGGPTIGTRPRIDLAHLPAGAEHFLGRGPELVELDTAWTPGSGIAVVELIAPGGTGKTALVKRWLEGVKARGWGGAAQVYGWSFYSQGTGDDRQASEDHFLAAAIKRLGVEIAPSANPADKGQALADRLGTDRTLLILDGLEPLQYPPGQLAGELRAPGLKTLLTQLAAAGHPGLCVVTSREWLQDLAEWVRGPANPRGCVLRLDLGNLSDTDGAALLHARGATRAGAAEIRPDDPELIAAAQEVSGHALALSLLGRYLARAKGGDICRRDAVDPARADRDARGHAARVVTAYETWFAREDRPGADSRSRELSVLRLLGFFDRPASRDLLEALRAAPPIPGLTESLQDLTRDDWTLVLANLADCGLVQPDPHAGAVDAHPLVREYLAAALAERCPDAWREGHRRIYERLKASVPHRPEGLDGLQPLYQAVAHGCRAGLWQDALIEVYIDRILRGAASDGFYSTFTLGAIGADLGVISCFFSEPWHRPAPALTGRDQAWLLHEAAFRLRAMARLGEALDPMRTAAEMAVQQEDGKQAAIYYGDLTGLELILGRVAKAVEDARRAVQYADRSRDSAQRLSRRADLADALHQRGEAEMASGLFSEAESMQAEHQPNYPLLYSIRGFLYCDLLLAGVERAVWGVDIGTAVLEHRPKPDSLVCDDVARRAELALMIAERSGRLLDTALGHLTVARCALYADRLAGRSPGQEAEAHAERALHGLRAAGRQDYLPRGLLTRAWLRHAQGNPAGAESDLAEAERIASRGGMQIHLADCALHRARLFRDRQALAQTRRLIETCHYGRRLPELEDAERAAATWVSGPEAGVTSPPATPGTAFGSAGITEPAAGDAEPGAKENNGRENEEDESIKQQMINEAFLLYFEREKYRSQLEQLERLDPRDITEFDTKARHCSELKDKLARIDESLYSPKPDAASPLIQELPESPTPYSARMVMTQHPTPDTAKMLGTPATTARFHCFLSHNSSDKPRVRELARALVGRGLRAWLDEEQLRPGLPWQPLLEQGIRDSAAVAVCIAADGLGPWQDAEMQAALQLAVRNLILPVIAVLLPGAPTQPALPAFLAVRGWVDLRAGIAADGLDQLIWGITGQRPGTLAPWPESPTAGVEPPSAQATTQPAQGSALPQQAFPGSPTQSRAAAMWRKKLGFLLEQEAVTSNPAQRFELSEQIEECRAKLRELGVEP